MEALCRPPQLHEGPWQPGVLTSEQGARVCWLALVSPGGHDEAESPSVGKTANWIQLLLREGTEAARVRAVVGPNPREKPVQGEPTGSKSLASSLWRPLLAEPTRAGWQSQSLPQDTKQRM